EVAEQILDGVKGRRRVGLDADLVRGVEVAEVQGGHDADQAGARGLVAAYLDAVTGVAVVVGGVDDAGGQPQDALLNGAEDLGAGIRPGHPRPGVGHAALLRPGPAANPGTPAFPLL